MTIDDVKFRAKYEAQKVKSALRRGWNWISDNKGTLMFVVPIASMVLRKIGKATRESNDERYSRTHTYDPVSHTMLRHDYMSDKKAEIFAQRRNNGDRVIDILKDLHLI